MEDEKKELEILKETIEHMKKAEKCMRDCENITNIEYEMFCHYVCDLEDRAMKLEIDINGCILEEV